MEDGAIQTLKLWLGSGSLNIFGRPFSGKDTQAQFLAKIFDAPVIGGGDVIRASSNNDIKDVMYSGSLAPTQAYLDMVLPYFARKEFVGKPLVLSTVGRWHGEEESVVEALKQSNHDLQAVIFLTLSENQVYKRRAIAKSLGDRGRRADDAHGVLDVRLKEFRDKTLPVLDYYKDKGLLVEIDGNQTQEKVTQDILKALVSRAST